MVGAFVAIIVGKQVFGGLGQNLFNPAMVARVVLLVSFPLEMTQWVGPHPLFFARRLGLDEALTISLDGLAAPWDAMSGASILGQVDLALQQGGDLAAAMPTMFSPLGALLGGIPGSLGETSALLLLLGGLFLLRKGVIDWVIPVAVLLGIAVPASLLHLIDPTRFAGPLLHLLAGATLLTAFFIATDPVTSPVSRIGQAVFGAGIGLLIYLIRTFGAYPEGAAFAILLMNAATPMIDHYLKPRIFGRDRRGQPLPVPEAATGQRRNRPGCWSSSRGGQVMSEGQVPSRALSRVLPGALSRRLPALDREGVAYQTLLLGGFALAASALLVVGNLLTKGPIAQREAEDLRASLEQVIPDSLHDNDLLANPLLLPPSTADTAITVYRALDGLDVTAVAFETVGQGYAGPIRVLLGIGADGRILGARVLAHTETPGLGDKIEISRDDWITAFNGRQPQRSAARALGGEEGRWRLRSIQRRDHHSARRGCGDQGRA